MKSAQISQESAHLWRCFGVLLMIFVVFAVSASRAIASAYNCESVFRPDSSSTDQHAFTFVKIGVMPGVSRVKYVTAEIKQNEAGSRHLTLRDDSAARVLDDVDLDSASAPYGPIAKMQIDVYRSLTAEPDNAAVRSERRGNFLNRHYINYRPIIYLIEANKVHILEYTDGPGLFRQRTIEARGVVFVEPVSAKVKDPAGILTYRQQDAVRIYFGNGLTTPIVYDAASDRIIPPTDVLEVTSRDPMKYL